MQEKREYEIVDIDELIQEQGSSFWNLCQTVDDMAMMGEMSDLEIAELMDMHPRVIRQIHQYNKYRELTNA